MEVSREEEDDDVVVDISSWCDFFSEVSRFVDMLERQYGLANVAFTEYAVLRLSTTIRSLQSIEEALIAHENSDDLEEIIGYVNELSDILMVLQSVWSSYEEAMKNTSVVQRVPPTVGNGRGRPRFDITQEQIEYLRYLSFSWSSISSLLGVSRMTLYRRKKQFGISSTNSSLTDSELDERIREIRRELPYSGETIVMGRLRSIQCCIPRKRVRESIRRIDPLNTPLRWGRNRHSRRPYSVPGPNCLWHLDGHHKLIRWRLVTHGGIDGYSRLIVYLHCSSNTRHQRFISIFCQQLRRTVSHHVCVQIVDWRILKSLVTCYNIVVLTELFTEGALRMHISGLNPVEYPNSEYSEYGVEELHADESDDNSDLEGVHVPQMDANNQYSHLIEFVSNQVNPLAESDSIAIDIYQRVLRTMEQSINNIT
ncbi:uncharacterized protein LOC135338911 [Halichondria panicea]|uniref:uncharacterized protein LOC135338911 n=1 Tax=Halichondria panicea TaxID=6063 RepID=UPI00312B3534